MPDLILADGGLIPEDSDARVELWSYGLVVNDRFWTMAMIDYITLHLFAVSSFNFLRSYNKVDFWFLITSEIKKPGLASPGDVEDCTRQITLSVLPRDFSNTVSQIRERDSRQILQDDFDGPFR